MDQPSAPPRQRRPVGCARSGVSSTKQRRPLPLRRPSGLPPELRGERGPVGGRTFPRMRRPRCVGSAAFWGGRIPHACGRSRCVGSAAFWDGPTPHRRVAAGRAGARGLVLRMAVAFTTLWRLLSVDVKLLLAILISCGWADAVIHQDSGFRRAPWAPGHVRLQASGRAWRVLVACPAWWAGRL